MGRSVPYDLGIGTVTGVISAVVLGIVAIVWKRIKNMRNISMGQPDQKPVAAGEQVVIDVTSSSPPTSSEQVVIDVTSSSPPTSSSFSGPPTSSPFSGWSSSFCGPLPFSGIGTNIIGAVVLGIVAIAWKCIKAWRNISMWQPDQEPVAAGEQVVIDVTSSSPPTSSPISDLGRTAILENHPLLEVNDDLIIDTILRRWPGHLLQFSKVDRETWWLQ